MNVLLVNHLLDAVSGGGTAERTLQLARGMAQAGVDCTLLALDIGLTPERRDALKFARLEAVHCLNTRYFIPRLSMRRVRELVFAADIVLVSGHWTVINAMVALACRQVGRPYLFAPAGALAPFGRSLLLKRVYDIAAGQSMVRGASSCIAVTEAERADFAPYGIEAGQVPVIPNGIDPADYRSADPLREGLAFRARAGLGQARFAMFLGRLNLIKGPDLLVEAFASLSDRMPDLHLVMAGPDDGMLPALQALVLSRGLAQRVHFTGFLGGADKAAALREASLLVIPSRREAMSIVVLEGGACGCPVLFTDACGLEDIARRGAGAMVAPSAAALATEMERLLQDGSACAEMAGLLQQIVEQEYSWTAQAQRHIALAVHCLGGIAQEAG